MSVTAPHASSAAGAYVLLDTLPAALALPATSVLGIARAADWREASPRSFTVLLPVQFSASEPAWVLNLVAEDQPIAVMFSGTIRMNYFYLDSLLPMTSFKYNGFSEYSHLVLANGEPLALVVNVRALFERIANKN